MEAIVVKRMFLSLVSVGLLALAGAGVVAADRGHNDDRGHDDDRQAGVLFRSTLTGIPTGGMVLRGVPGGGLPWVSEGEVRLDGSGRLRAKVEGLLLAAGANAGTVGSVTAVVASLTCEGMGVVATTGPAPLNARGDARIDEMIALPDGCLAPVILIRNAAGSQAWFATSGF
jgi:hypothetical protein